MRSWSRCSWNHLSWSTTSRCPKHISGTLLFYLGWIHMYMTNPDSRHIWIVFLKIWLMIQYNVPRKVRKLNVILMVSKMVPLKSMTPKSKISLLTSLRPSDYGCRNTNLIIYLPIYLLVHNIYLITNNYFYLFIQASFDFHVIEWLAWFPHMFLIF